MISSRRLGQAALLVLTTIAGCALGPGGPAYVVSGTAKAGPTCPVVFAPAPSECDERPVAGAVLVITNASGHEVARPTTATDGSFSTQLPSGEYTLTPGPVEGLIGGGQPIQFSVTPDGYVTSSGQIGPLAVEYDTGIR